MHAYIPTYVHTYMFTCIRANLLAVEIARLAADSNLDIVECLPEYQVALPTNAHSHVRPPGRK